MSWKPRVKVVNNGDKWSLNGLCFATQNEAEQNAFDLMMRWTSCEECGAVEVDEPVTHTYIDGVLGHLQKTG